MCWKVPGIGSETTSVYTLISLSLDVPEARISTYSLAVPSQYEVWLRIPESPNIARKSRPPILQRTAQNSRGCPSKSRADPIPTISVLSASTKSPPPFSETGFSLKHESRTSSAVGPSTSARIRSYGPIGPSIGSSDFYKNWLPGPELIRTFLPISIFCSIAHSRKRRFYRICYGVSPTHAQLSLHRPSPPHQTMEERAKRFQAMLDSGQVRNRADLARKLGCSRAWVTSALSAGTPSQ